MRSWMWHKETVVQMTAALLAALGGTECNPQRKQGELTLGGREERCWTEVELGKGEERCLCLSSTVFFFFFCQYSNH